MRPRFFRPPKYKCEVCGEQLFDRYRYKVWLYLKKGPLANTVFKELVVCGKCLRKIVEDGELRSLFKVKYRRMKTLGLGI